MEKNVFTIRHAANHSHEISFPSGETITAETVFELNDFVIAGGKVNLFVFDKKQPLALAHLKIKNKFFSEEYFKDKNELVLNYYGANHFVIFDFDEMTCKKMGNDKAFVSFSKDMKDLVFFKQDIASKNWIVQINKHKYVYKHFLRLEHAIVFGTDKIFIVKNLQTGEKTSLKLEDDVSLKELCQGKNGFISILKLNNDKESFFDLISGEIITGKEYVKRL
ncbi:MAG: hypothetical protein PHE89_02160 [Alphaproteobacteria bacterium]|nr:hypothetical protein [Alphaproteobacteria bacterium]